MRKLIVPNFSMRSYVTDKYAVLKDGNFQLHLHRAQKDDLIVVPFNSSDTRELADLFPEYNFVQLQYGYNVQNTRDYFWVWNQSNVDSIMELHNIDLLVTDIAGYCGKHEYIYNMNVAKHDYYGKDVKMIAGSKMTYVLNESVKTGFGRLDRNILSKIKVSQKVINPHIMAKYVRMVYEAGLQYQERVSGELFHPFRISDNCYDIKRVVQTCNEHKWSLVLTDPNDTWKEKEGWLMDAWPVDVSVVKMSKIEYYAKLMSNPMMMYNENPEETFHPGLGELIFFDVQLISDHKIPSRDDVIIGDGEDVWLS